MSQHKKNISVKCKILLKKYLIFSFLDKIFKIYVETTHCKCGVFLPKWDNKMNLEHTRHRSPINAFVHILSTLVGYSLKKNKPSTKFDFNLHVHNILIPN
ncbi:hypothetical protein [Candidatus Tisiphia endosymbiont of Parasteatoda lunata]|uniref:hypothetical protein n=1 Tax=Candidatus Tisiphia endosymbiont of Parasteatoda lunata TaxID=3066275 RepID=UPI00313B48C4